MLLRTAIFLLAVGALGSTPSPSGKVLFVRSCAGCHGNDGKALMDAGGDATDLTDPKVYRHGSTDAAILSSMRDGANGMPAFRSELKDEEFRLLLDFIHSLWPKGSNAKTAP